MRHPLRLLLCSALILVPLAAGAEVASQQVLENATSSAQARSDALKAQQDEDANQLRQLRRKLQDTADKARPAPTTPQFGVKKKKPSALDQMKQKQGKLFIDKGIGN
ncbi:hypothetical protein KM176_17890 [Pseudooceanicola sp. CBS1P-1]|uniref:Uncharacterized protein n=1 Tax=Pseudooceanicola albus TaxID=2692189 RepID=A0A6L7G7S1_9RHOB|nr:MULTISPECIES: hypothetical protein [Pseudooceanicola]MBT9385747.1 hypothetical protein [Pseudooceanicola endophyticus]MXN19979.1 hypothetical protein [Pseudooceanicola albus]